MRYSKLVRVVDKVDHDKLSADALLAWSLHDRRLVKGGCIGVDGKDDIALAQSFDTTEHNDLLLRQVKDW